MSENEKLLNENQSLKNFLYNQTKQIQDCLQREFSNYMNVSDLIKIKRIVLNIPEIRLLLEQKYTINLDYDMFFNVRLSSIICANFASDTALLSNEEKNAIIHNEAYIADLVKEVTLSAMISNNISEELLNSLFMANPMVNSILSISEEVKKEIDSKSVLQKTKLAHPEHQRLSALHVYIRDAMNALQSVFILVNHKAYPQALGVFRGVLEQTITIDTLAHYPHVLPRFFEHIELKMKDAMGHTKEVNEYLVGHGINPQDMTLRSKYIDYGWLDEIEEFNGTSKKMYRVKTMAQLIHHEALYEWYASWSDFVHSNFIFAKNNWNHVVNLLLRQISEVMQNLTDLYNWLNGERLIISQIDALAYLKGVINKSQQLLELDDIKFDFGLGIES